LAVRLVNCERTINELVAKCVRLQDTVDRCLVENRSLRARVDQMDELDQWAHQVKRDLETEARARR
jgi:hypothetical protein